MTTIRAIFKRAFQSFKGLGSFQPNTGSVANHPPSGAEEAGRRAAFEAILNAYAIIYFSRQPRLGAFLMAATFLAPEFGLFGLAGVVTAFAAARYLGFAQSAVRNGELLYNSLLASLALAYLSRYHPLPPALLLVLLPAVSIAALFLSVGLGRLTRQLAGLPSLSLPFVSLTTILYLLIYSVTATPVVGTEPSYILPEPGWLPNSVAYFFQSFGAVFFLPHSLAGMAIVAAILSHSRLMPILGAVGFTAGLAFLHLTGLQASAFGAGWLGTNFVFCGIALGGIYFIPSRSSLILACLGPVLCTLIAVAIRAFLRNYSIPPLSLPFVLVMMAVVYALRQRERFDAIFESPYIEVTPEENARRFHLARKRFPDAAFPALYLPFTGERVVTQGFDGPITHQGKWRHALDFEALDAAGEPLPAQRQQLEDSYTFGSPVLAPCDGHVVRVVNHVPDNPLGGENLVENWGNMVILRTDFGSHVLLCHFKCNGIVVYENQRVWRGQFLGYCGNSGRSPLPHLHLHLQTAWYPGSPTTPFRLLHYISHHGKSKSQFHLTGLPQAGARIAPLRYDADVAACFSAQVATRVRYRIESMGHTIGWETLETTSDDAGQLCYRSLEHGVTMNASTLNGIHFVQELEGLPNSLILALLRLSIGAVPFSQDRDLCWEDHCESRPFRTRFNGWIADLLEPFTAAGFLHVCSGFQATDRAGELVIVSEIAADGRSLSNLAPHHLEVRLSRDAGLVELTATWAGRTIRIVQERWEAITRPPGATT